MSFFKNLSSSIFSFVLCSSIAFSFSHISFGMENQQDNSDQNGAPKRIKIEPADDPANAIDTPLKIVMNSSKAESERRQALWSVLREGSEAQKNSLWPFFNSVHGNPQFPVNFLDNLDALKQFGTQSLKESMGARILERLQSNFFYGTVLQNPDQREIRANAFAMYLTLLRSSPVQRQEAAAQALSLSLRYYSNCDDSMYANASFFVARHGSDNCKKGIIPILLSLASSQVLTHLPFQMERYHFILKHIRAHGNPSEKGGLCHSLLGACSYPAASLKFCLDVSHHMEEYGTENQRGALCLSLFSKLKRTSGEISPQERLDGLWSIARYGTLEEKREVCSYFQDTSAFTQRPWYKLALNHILEFGSKQNKSSICPHLAAQLDSCSQQEQLAYLAAIGRESMESYHTEIMKGADVIASTLINASLPAVHRQNCLKVFLHKDATSYRNEELDPTTWLDVFRVVLQDPSFSTSDIWELFRDRRRFWSLQQKKSVYPLMLRLFQDPVCEVFSYDYGTLNDIIKHGDKKGKREAVSSVLFPLLKQVSTYHTDSPYIPLESRNAFFTLFEKYGAPLEKKEACTFFLSIVTHPNLDLNKYAEALDFVYTNGNEEQKRELFSALYLRPEESLLMYRYGPIFLRYASDFATKDQSQNICQVLSKILKPGQSHRGTDSLLTYLSNYGTEEQKKEARARLTELTSQT